MSISTETLKDFISGQGYGVAPSAVVAICEDLLAVREAQSGPTGKFAGWGVYHAGRDGFGSWLKSTPEADNSHAITKHGYVNVKLYTAPPAPAVPKAITVRQAIAALNDADGVTSMAQAYKLGFNACRAAMLQPVSHGYTLPVGEIVAWAGTQPEKGIMRDIAFQFHRFDVQPGTKLYPGPPAPDEIDRFVEQVCGDEPNPQPKPGEFLD